MNRVWALLRNLTRRGHAALELDEELRSCLEILTREKVERGMAPVEARRQAFIELGGLEQVRLRVKEVKMGSALEALVLDIRFGLRTLRQSKGWTAVIVLSLGLGIGANTVMFSLVNGLFLRSIDVAQPDTLVRLHWAGPADFTGLSDTSQPDAVTGHDLRSGFSRIVWDRLRQNTTMPDLMAVALQQVIVFANGDSQWADGLAVSGNYYDILGIRPFQGRLLTRDDDKDGAPSVAVLSYAYWSTRFAKDPNIVGKTVTANDTPVTVVGITSPNFLGVESLSDDGQDITFPLEMGKLLNHIPPQTFATAGAWNTNWVTFGVQLMGRLPHGLTAAQVQGSLDGVFREAARLSWTQALSRLTPAQRALPQFQNRTQPPTLVVESGRRGLNDTDRQTIRSGQILTIVVVLLLLIVCANVANLVLSRATTRRREISVRLSMGATRGRLIRQLLTESLLLASAGGLLGLAINHWGRALVPSSRWITVSYDMPIVNVGLMPELDWRVLAFIVGLTLFTGILFGLVPAVQATRVQLATELKQNSRSVSGSRSLMSRGLLVSQVAISIVLLAGAGLLLRTVSNLRDVAVGFNPDKVVTFHLSVRAVADQARLTTLFQRIMENSRSLPGVRSAAGTSIAFWQSHVFGSVRVALPGSTDSSALDVVGITPGFFETMQIPLLAGRDVADQDMTPPSRVALINEAARSLFRGKEPISESIELQGQNQTLEVIGIAGNVKFGDVRDPARPLLYIPGRQTTFVVRTDADMKTLAPAIREMVRELDPMVPVTDIVTEQDLIEGRLQPERVLASFYVLFGALALLLASIGLFGLMSYNVARRTNEIGLRMALGARRYDVVRMVMRESLTLVGIGVLIGSGGAIILGRWISSQLYGLSSIDVVAMSAAIGIMIAVSLLASYIPALRASTVDPLTALHHD